ncbi:hypothetical protein H263_02484 [Brachyspira hampsonii 30599]|nr:hypothetical protein [Brachyspira hampsonii]ELV06710.1 hypothetical protein H263_02484 [Brachyspira hampsonii 30599]
MKKVLFLFFVLLAFSSCSKKEYNDGWFNIEKIMLIYQRKNMTIAVFKAGLLIIQQIIMILNRIK